MSSNNDQATNPATLLCIDSDLLQQQQHPTFPYRECVKIPTSGEGICIRTEHTILTFRWAVDTQTQHGFITVQNAYRRWERLDYGSRDHHTIYHNPQYNIYQRVSNTFVCKRPTTFSVLCNASDDCSTSTWTMSLAVGCLTSRIGLYPKAASTPSSP